ncbi:MAG: hypothetical protein WDO70_03155 [Alphaproteobacteria bacterium]
MDGVINTTPQNYKIDFAPHMQPDEKDRDMISSWPVIQEHVARRDHAGFKTSRLQVNGAWFVGAGEKRKLLGAQARVFYKTPDGADSSYHVNFMPDAAALLLVFRVGAAAFAKRDQKVPLRNHHAMLVRQPRWGVGDPDTLEIPAGIIEQDGITPRFSIMDRAVLAALREFMEETGARGKELFSINSGTIQSLGGPVSCAVNLTEAQHQFSATIDVTARQFRKIQEAMQDATAGLASEQESTTVTIMPLKRAFEETLSGKSPFSQIAIARYMKREGLLGFDRSRVRRNEPGSGPSPG